MLSTSVVDERSIHRIDDITRERSVPLIVSVSLFAGNDSSSAESHFPLGLESLSPHGIAMVIGKHAAIGYRQETIGDSGNRSCRSSRSSKIGLVAWILS